MIVKSLDSDTELLRFIDNAEKFGHKIDAVLVAYALKYDRRVADRLMRRVPFFAIDIRNPHFCLERFRDLGISDDATSVLLKCPIDPQTHRGAVPYGFNRTVVLIEAILRGADIFVFVDSDVFPSFLEKTPDGSKIEEFDFFGAHLEQLKTGSQVTTAEYSGYNILPPASFDGMDDLLHGLQKADMLGYWHSSETHRCLTYQQPDREPKPCTKILGGNTAMKLSAFSKLPPFFSSYYTVGNEMFLSRGEDTVLGDEIGRNGMICTDTGLNPLHDTYKDYPVEPDLRRDRAAQERFFYACTGWVGRNPFLNYIRKADLRSVKGFQRDRLERGLRALAEYTSNPRYLCVMENFEVSWENLGRYADEYERVIAAWDEFRERGGFA